MLESESLASSALEAEGNKYKRQKCNPKFNLHSKFYPNWTMGKCGIYEFRMNRYFCYENSVINMLSVAKNKEYDELHYHIIAPEPHFFRMPNSS